MIELDTYRETLARIAQGRPDNGRALAGAEAQELARVALLKHGRPWPVKIQKGV